MQKVLTAEEMREVDRLTTERYGIPSILLMESAAHAAARVITEKLGGVIAGKSFLVLCGKGNNGGDGAALARILWTLGAEVFVYLFGKVEETKGDARVNFEILRNVTESRILYTNCLELVEVETAQSLSQILMSVKEHILVDAFFGTGLSRPVEGELMSFFMGFSRILSHSKTLFTVAVDLPSGLNADSEKLIGRNLQADLTVTFTAPKIANVFPPASNFSSELIVANIGSPKELVDNSPSRTFVAEKKDAQDWLNITKVKNDSYKKTRGAALIIAGSKNYTGAATLAANACFASGAGMVSVAVPKSVQDVVAAKVSDEIITRGFGETKDGAFAETAAKDILELSGIMDLLAIGCGLTSNDESTRKFVREVVEKRKTPIVVDADGLNSLAPFDLQGSNDLPIILTPHIGEFQRLLGTKDEIKDKIETARRFSQKHNVILLLKGERSIVAAPDGTVVINLTGNAGISRAGAGDTLAGIVTSFLAQSFAVKKWNKKVGETNLDVAFEAVVAALYVSGLAGDVAAEKFGQRLMTATDIRDCISEELSIIDKREIDRSGVNEKLTKELKRY
jgi:NAD(P)H-hydrate epimerase